MKNINLAPQDQMGRHADTARRFFSDVLDSQSDNSSHGLPLSNELMRHLHFASWNFVAGRRSTRLVRDAEVPFIR